MEAILLLDVVNVGKPLFDRVFYEDQEYKLQEKMEIKIKFNELESQIGSKCVTLKIKENKEEEQEVEEHHFEVSEGVNSGFLFTSHGKTRDLIFPEDEKVKIRIENGGKKIEKDLDLVQNCVKRLLLINLSYDVMLYINDKKLTYKIFDIDNEKSIQVSVVNLEQGLLPFKHIAPKSYEYFFEMFNKHYQDLKNFHDIFKEYLNSDDKKRNPEILKIALKNLDAIENMFYITKLNLPKKILEQNYNDEKYFDFLYLCSLMQVIKAYLSYIEDIDQMNHIYELLKEIKLKVEKDSDLQYYQKGIIIVEYGILLKNVENFEKVNFSYYLTKNFEKDSIGYCCMEFLREFCDNIDEKSPFYFPLILIDSGSYTYEGECIYGFGLINKKMLISHLKEIIPDVICTYYAPDFDEDGLTDKSTGCVAVNLSSIFESLEKVNICKAINDKRTRDNFALKMVIILFHEIFGHKKTGYNSDVNSPHRFFDKKSKNLMVLKYRNSFEKGENIINILRDQNFKHDSGHFIEYFFGKCESGFIFELLEMMLSDNIDMSFLFNISFFNDKIDTLRKYVEYKYLVYEENKELLENNKYQNIDEEISSLKKIIQEKKKISSNEKKNEKISSPKIKPFQNPKKKLLATQECGDIDYNYYIEKSNEEIKKKLQDNKVSPQLKKILRQIMFERTVKK